MHITMCHAPHTVPHLLFKHLYYQVYDTPYTGLVGRYNVVTAEHANLDMAHMAQVLRKQGWKIYYWREPIDNEQEYYDRGWDEGLIIGRYCENLIIWLLSHT
jgi:hypothetical protein